MKISGPIKIVPPNEIIKSFGEFRIVKVYFLNNNAEYSYINLERRYKNLAGESYYALAFDNPNNRGECIGSTEIYDYFNKVVSLNEELVKELAK